MPCYCSGAHDAAVGWKLSPAYFGCIELRVRHDPAQVLPGCRVGWRQRCVLQTAHPPLLLGRHTKEHRIDTERPADLILQEIPDVPAVHASQDLAQDPAVGGPVVAGPGPRLPPWR